MLGGPMEYRDEPASSVDLAICRANNLWLQNPYACGSGTWVGRAKVFLLLGAPRTLGKTLKYSWWRCYRRARACGSGDPFPKRSPLGRGRPSS